jgi:hypothetical protein
MDSSKKILIVSYVFPPMAAVGGHRIVNFCKYLPGFKWKPVVLTVKNGFNFSWDDTLLKKIPDTAIYRSIAIEPLVRLERWKKVKRGKFSQGKKEDMINDAPPKSSIFKKLKRLLRYFLTIPDDAIFWIPLAIIKGFWVIRKEKISVIMSSSPPVSTHILASILSRLTGLPYIADFRDLWTLNHTYQDRGYPGYIRSYDKFWESFSLKRAKRIITASPGFTRQMQEHTKEYHKNQIVTITNGFDYDEVDLEQELPQSGGKKFEFLYTGSLYGDFNPVFFLECLSEWIKRYNIDRQTVQVSFYGNHDFDYSHFVEDLNLADVVFFHGFKSRSELLSIYPQADYSLLLLGFKEQARNVIPAKLFDYLASGAKILALSPEGVSVELVKKYNAGVYLSKPDKERMISIFMQVYKKWLAEPNRMKKYRYIDEIDRRNLTGRLSELLDDVTSQSGRGKA